MVIIYYRATDRATARYSSRSGYTSYPPEGPKRTSGLLIGSETRIEGLLTIYHFTDCKRLSNRRDHGWAFKSALGFKFAAHQERQRASFVDSAAAEPVPVPEERSVAEVAASPPARRPLQQLVLLRFSTALISPGTRLFCRARARFRPHRRTVAGGQPVPKVGLLAPTLSRRFKVSGSQRVLLLDAVAGADAGHKRRPENRLMMRRRDPVKVAPAWSKSILPRRFRATRQYQGLDLTGARIGHAILASPFL